MSLSEQKNYEVKNHFALNYPLKYNNFLIFSCFFYGDKISCYSHVLSGQSADLSGLQSHLIKFLKYLKFCCFLFKMFNCQF